MQTAQILNDYKFKNIINCNSNNKCEKKIRTQYSNSKYRDIFFRENNKLKRALNHKYWVAIQLEKLEIIMMEIMRLVLMENIHGLLTMVFQQQHHGRLTTLKAFI